MSRWLGRGPSRPVSENAQSARNLPRSWATGVRSGPRAPRPRAPSSLRRARELEPALVSPAAAPPEHCSRPGMLLPGWSVYPSSGFSKHTFVSTHATGARTHTPRVRAHSPGSCRQRARDARLRSAAASALSAHLDLRLGSAPGAGLWEAKAHRTCAALTAVLEASERPILLWIGSLGRRRSRTIGERSLLV